jgi:hypothetical protein
MMRPITPRQPEFIVLVSNVANALDAGMLLKLNPAVPG